MSFDRFPRNNVEGLYLTEDTSGANAQLVLETPARGFARVLSGVEVVCSASSSITATTVIKRPITSGTVEIQQVDIAITADTSGAVYADVYLRPQDVVEVTVPAAGVGVTCSAIILEEARSGIGTDY